MLPRPSPTVKWPRKQRRHFSVNPVGGSIPDKTRFESLGGPRAEPQRQPTACTRLSLLRLTAQASRSPATCSYPVLLASAGCSHGSSLGVPALPRPGRERVLPRFLERHAAVSLSTSIRRGDVESPTQELDRLVAGAKRQRAGHNAGEVFKRCRRDGCASSTSRCESRTVCQRGAGRSERGIRATRAPEPRAAIGQGGDSSAAC